LPKSDEIIAALGDTSGIDSYQTLKAEMIELFTDMADRMSHWKDQRPALIMRKMAATIDTVPHDMLAEFGHSYNPTLLACVTIFHVLCPDVVPDFADAHDLMQTLLDELRSIDLDHPDTQKAIEEIKVILSGTARAE
jgi:hypothetical protein